MQLLNNGTELTSLLSFVQGVVAFPYKVKRLGVVLGVLLNFGMAIVMVFSASVVVR